MSVADFEIKGLREFDVQIRTISKKMPEEIRKELLKLAYMLSREIVMQITNDNIVDTGRLRASFTVNQGSTSSLPSPSGSEGNGESEGGFDTSSKDSISVGTNVKYAQDINDGFNIKQHFVPGEWVNGKFKYTPYNGQKGVGGMTVHDRYVEGRHYMEKAMSNYQPIATAELEKWIPAMMEQIKNNNGGFTV